jgi:hypothetical protein
VTDIQKLEKLRREFIDELLASVRVYLRRNSELCEPVSVEGVRHCFSLLVGNRSDHSVLRESIRNAEDKFFITVRYEHWAKKVSVNPEVWAIRIRERDQWSSFVCGFFPLLAS